MSNVQKNDQMLTSVPKIPSAVVIHYYTWYTFFRNRRSIIPSVRKIVKNMTYFQNEENNSTFSVH